MKEKHIKDRFARKWLLMVIIGPGIFFVLYWLIAVNGATTDNSNLGKDLPDNYYERGKAVKIENITLQAGLQNRNIFVQEMKISPNNQVKSQGGEKFFIVPVFFNNSKIENTEIELIDSSGDRYKPLEIAQKYQAAAARLKESELPSGKSLLYFTFKVNRDTEGYYLVIKTKNENATWYFPDSS